MSYSIKAVIIVTAVAVVSFIVAELAIPERSAVVAKEEAARERHKAAQAAAAAVIDEDIPVVVVEHPTAQPAADAAAPADAKAEPADAKASKTSDAKTMTALQQKPDAQKTAAPAQAQVPPVQPPPPAQRQAASSQYRIEKAALCAAIQNREPQGISDRFSKDAPFVYYFTPIVGARDSTAVIHRWYQNGKLIQTSVLPVKSQYWRTHSRRNLLTHNGDVTGQWRVDVVEPGSNKVMESASFIIE